MANNSTKEKIEIVGLGHVGSAVYWFKNFCFDRVNLFLYDKYKNNSSVAHVNQADIIFICIPTLYYEEDKGVAEFSPRSGIDFAQKKA